MINLKALNIKDKRIENKIENKIDTFVNNIVKDHGSNIQSIVLLGSVARGEIKYTQTRIKSDLDFLVIIKKPLFLSRKTSKQYKDIDYTFFIKRNLKLVPKSSYWFDIKNTGVTVYGANLLSEIKEIKKTDISKDSLFSIIFTRMTNLVSVFDLNYYTNKKYDTKKIIHESSKALLCTTDVISIFLDSYSSVASKRFEITINNKNFHNNDFKNIIKDVNLAFKTINSEEKTKNLDLWFKAKECILFLNDFCEKNIGKRKQWKYFDYIRYYYQMFKYNNTLPKIVKNPYLYWRLSLLHLLKSVEKQKINDSELKLSIKYLNKLYRININYTNVNDGWIKTKKELVKLHDFLPDPSFS